MHEIPSTKGWSPALAGFPFERLVSAAAGGTPVGESQLGSLMPPEAALTCCIRGAAVAASQRTKVSDLDAVVMHFIQLATQGRSE